MKTILLTQGKTALVDDADYDRLSSYSWQAKRRPVKNGPEVWYAKRRAWKGENPAQPTIYMHREIMGLSDPALDVDHEDGDGLNNQRDNLRVCGRADNNRNMIPKGIAHYKGVYRNGKGWSAKIKVNGRQVYLGQFENPSAAAVAFDQAAKATGNTYYRLNFPQINQPINSIIMSQELKSYEKVHEVTGQIVPQFKYLTGHPKQYRFDGKAGVFNINGDAVIGKTLSFQPIAWRIFTDNILGMGTKNWAEIFFVDDKNCVSAILFHGYSVDELFGLIEPLFYEDLTLADVVITATTEKKTRAADNGTWYLCQFSYKMADVEQTRMLQSYAKDHRIFRQETLTDIANIKASTNYFNPFHLGGAADLGLPAPDGVDAGTGEMATS